MFKLKDQVSWTSQAMGCSMEKAGRVVAVVPAGQKPEHHVPVVLEFLIKFGGGSPRNHESYLVLVDRGVGKKPTLYWPLVSKLTKVGGEEASGPVKHITINIKGKDFTFQTLADLPGIDYPQTRLGLLSQARAAQKEVIDTATEILGVIHEEIEEELRKEKKRRVKFPGADGKTLVFEIKHTLDKLVVRSEKTKKEAVSA